MEGLWAEATSDAIDLTITVITSRIIAKGIQIGIDRNYFEYKDSYRCRDKDGENFPVREKAHEWIYGAGLSLYRRET